MSFPTHRLRRLRGSPVMRRMVRETHVTVDDLIYPLFVTHAETAPINSMPGINRFSINDLCREVELVANLGISAVMLFGISEEKDDVGSGGYSEDGVIPRALRALKKEIGDEVLLFADVCLCEYTSHGHCGVIDDGRWTMDDGSAAAETGSKSSPIVHRPSSIVANDPTVELLAKAAVVYAQSGADVIAPSDMMDGRVAAIRNALDTTGFLETPILAYAAKYASGFYGPFREAAGSTPQFGDRRTYQMDPANRREAMREVALDIEEGADIIMVKPALPYLDIIRDVRERFDLPVSAYNVSGEYAMVKAAAQNGWIEEDRVIAELLTSIKRAGADIILTYHAKEFAERGIEHY